MDWQEARDCVKAYCSKRDISLNHSKIEDFNDGTLTSYEPGFDLHPIELSWCKLFDAILIQEHLDNGMPKDVFMIWNDMTVNDMHAVE